MLRHVLVISRSGLVLFSKAMHPQLLQQVSLRGAWFRLHTGLPTQCMRVVNHVRVCVCVTTQPNLVGSLVRALIELSTSAVGLPVSYMEFASRGGCFQPCVPVVSPFGSVAPLSARAAVLWSVGHLDNVGVGVVRLSCPQCQYPLPLTATLA